MKAVPNAFHDVVMNALGLGVYIPPFLPQLRRHFSDSGVGLEDLDVMVQLDLRSFLVEPKHQHAQQHQCPKRSATRQDGLDGGIDDAEAVGGRFNANPAPAAYPYQRANVMLYTNMVKV